MSAFLGAAGHAEDLLNVVERHRNLEESVFGGAFCFSTGRHGVGLTCTASFLPSPPTP